MTYLTMNESTIAPKCVDRFGAIERTDFIHRSCSLCYVYLFQKSKSMNLASYTTLAYKSSGNDTEQHKPVSPHPDDPESMDYVCNSLETEECEKWTSCCQTAVRCCDDQLQMASEVPTGYCSRVWDGYSCWADTLAGSTVTTQCPWFIPHAVTNREAIKQCTENATWFSKDKVQWTNYTPCADRESYLVGVYLTVGLSLASIALLIPAIIILSVFKDLRKQHRVRLHIQFFLALTLCAVAHILWFSLIDYDVVVNQINVLTNNPVWCRVLSFTKIYLSSVTYVWMFCEGYYLHRLITKAFEPPKTLVPLYLLGWGLPILPVTVYSIIRALLKNDSCWAISYSMSEWIVYVPNLICLLTNLIFLCNIMRILLFQLHSHPHEPSNFRRGLKAVFMLIPLFGLQLFLTIYRPEHGAPGQKGYEYFQYIINSSQGIFVSLIFCFFNGEVITQLSQYFKCCPYSKKRQARRRCSVQMTQVTSADDCRSHSSSHSNKSPRPSISNGSSPNKYRNNIASMNGDSEALTMYPSEKDEPPTYFSAMNHLSPRTSPGSTIPNGSYNNRKVKYSKVNTIADT